MSDAAVAVQGLHKSYHMGKVSLHVLRGVSLTIPRGSFTAVIGASGSGKSTLLHLVGLLDRPDKGTIIINDQDAAGFSGAMRNRVRCRDVGFVFQFYHLLPELNVLENVLLPAMVDSSVASWPSRRGATRQKALAVLEELGLHERLKHRPKELSGGERQRVAIARALINEPKILLADEPTGNLDSRTGRHILDIIRKIHDKSGLTTVMVTHDANLAKQADRVLHLADGRLQE